jgi:TolB-like protein
MTVGARFVASILLLFGLCAHADAEDKPTVAIIYFDIRPESSELAKSGERLVQRMQSEFRKNGMVNSWVITRLDLQTLGGSERTKAKYTVKGRVDIQGERLTIAVELADNKASGAAAIIVWEANRVNDISIYYWLDRVVSRIHEKITKTTLPKSIFVNCFDTHLAPQLKELSWRVPSRLATRISAQSSGKLRAGTFLEDEISGKCESFQSTPDSLSAVASGSVKEYDYVLSGNIRRVGAGVEVPIVIRSTVDSGSNRTLGEVRIDRRDVEPVVDKLADHFRAHWPQVTPQ